MSTQETTTGVAAPEEGESHQEIRKGDEARESEEGCEGNQDEDCQIRQQGREGPGIDEAQGGRDETIYDDENRKITIKKDLISFGDGKLQTISEYDALGRLVLTRTSEPGNSDAIKVQSIYNVESRGASTPPMLTMSP